MTESKSTGGFRGTRNNDTTAARAARSAKAKARKIDAARDLLTAEGYLTASPAQLDMVRENDEDAWHLREIVNLLTDPKATTS